MPNTENVVPSKLYTTEGAASQKQTRKELEKDDPDREQGIAIVSGKSKVEKDEDDDDNG